MRPRCQRGLPGNQVQVGGEPCAQRRVGVGEGTGEIALPHGPTGAQNLVRVPQCQPVQGVPGAGGALSVLGLVAFMIR